MENPRSRSRQSSFSTAELKRQLRYFDAVAPQRKVYRDVPHRFATLADNLAPSISGKAERYFTRNKSDAIAWHTHANHMLSSQACCLNFLMPLAEDPQRLSRLVGRALEIEPPQMLEVERGPDGEPWYVGFEWVGEQDYLNEGRPGTPLRRGANSTSADAFVRFRTGRGTEGLLIEWKYTESYGAPLPDRSRIRPGETEPSGGHATRRERYEKLVFAEEGPLKPDPDLSLDDFFWEPFYQLLRQQMLAHRMEKHGEADVVRVLHISPAGNRKLHAVTSEKFARRGATDAFDFFRSLLVHPDRFRQRTTEDVFGDLLAQAPPDDPWASYIRQRYSFMGDGSPVEA
jgi:hypothetical protein